MIISVFTNKELDMNCNCNDKNNSCCDMIDDLLEQIQAGLGQVDYDKIDEYIDEKINELREEIISGDIEIEIDYEELENRVKAIIASGDVNINAYDVFYKGTTVGAKLDELSKGNFEGKISPLRNYEIGEIAYNVRLSWTFSKPLKSLKLDGIELDPTIGYFDIPQLNQTKEFVLTAVSKDDERLVLTAKANFLQKYYVGCTGGTIIKNTEVLGLNSYFAEEGINTYKHIFNPIGKQYMWWIFPVDLHTDYDFFNNGLMDSNYEWKTADVTNAHGYTSPYIFIRSGNPQTAHNIYSEVKAHEHK